MVWNIGMLAKNYVWEVVYFSDCEKILLNSEGECLQNLYQ